MKIHKKGFEKKFHLSRARLLRRYFIYPMETQVVEFYNELFEENSVRVFGSYENPLFVANDVAKILEIEKIRNTLSNFRNDEAHTMGVTDNIGRTQNTWVLTERGLIKLMYKSRSEIAEKFQDFVYNLLHNLRTKKIRLLETRNKELEDKQKAIEANKIPGFIYKVTNNITGEFYIGHTIQSLKARWSDHKKALHKSRSKFYKNMAEYGYKNFKIEVYQTHLVINERELRKIESEIIREQMLAYPDLLLNENL